VIDHFIYCLHVLISDVLAEMLPTPGEQNVPEPYPRRQPALKVLGGA